MHGGTVKMVELAVRTSMQGEVRSRKECGQDRNLRRLERGGDGMRVKRRDRIKVDLTNGHFSAIHHPNNLIISE